MRRRKHEFSDEDIKYIVENWGKESPHSMKKKFGCTWYAVCKVAENHGLKIPTSNDWTEEQVKQLKELSEDYDKETIAQLMNKTENAIYLKARRLNITLIQSRRKWTKQEEKVLQTLWGVEPIEAIAKKLKRTVFSLKVKAVRMKIGPMISNNYEILTINDINELLDVSRDRITTTWVKLGLNLEKLKLTENTSYYTITLENLMDFLEKNQNEWDSRNLESNMLGEEPEWLLEKRNRDLEENPLWYRKWMAEEIIEAEKLFGNGKTYAEIATTINRTEWAVANLLRNMGYKDHKYWNDDEIQYLNDNYKNMTYVEIADKLGRTTSAVTWKAENLGYQKRITKSKSKDLL